MNRIKKQLVNSCPKLQSTVKVTKCDMQQANRYTQICIKTENGVSLQPMIKELSNRQTGIQYLKFPKLGKAHTLSILEFDPTA